MEQGMCNRVAELIREWERTGQLSPEELALVGGHVGQCRRCASAHGALLPLLRLDAGRPSGLSAVPSPLSGSFTERLMGRLAAKTPAGGIALARRRARAVRLPLAVAASVALLIAAGFLAWFWGLRPGRQEVLVRFELVAPEARNVNLVGDFSDWDPHRLAMKDVSGEGDWQIAIRLKRGRVYTYNFLLNGRRWIADPSSLRHVDDGFGGTSSVLDL